MAVNMTPASAGSTEPAATFTMSLTRGWDKIITEDGGRPLAAGDAVFLEVRRPAVLAAGPSGWTRVGGNFFWKIIGPPGQEQPPTFYAPYAGEWEIHGYAVASAEITSFDDGGSAVDWTP